VYQITAHTIICYLSPAACWQTNIRPVQVREKRTVFAGVPAKDEQRTGNCSGLTNRFRVPRRTDGPRRCLTVIEAKDGPNFLINFQFTKVRRLLRPPNAPAYAADEIAFVNAIPGCRSNLDE